MSDPERGEEVLLGRRRGLVIIKSHQVRRLRRLNNWSPPLLLVLVYQMLAERCVGDVGRQSSGRLSEESQVRFMIAGPHRVELVGAPEIGPGAALWLRDVRAERPVHGRASEAYEDAMVDNGPDRRRRTTISTFCVIGPPPDPLQFGMSFLVVLSNFIKRIVRPELRRPHRRGGHSVKERLGRQSARLIDGFVEHRTRGTLTVP